MRRSAGQLTPARLRRTSSGGHSPAESCFVRGGHCLGARQLYHLPTDTDLSFLLNAEVIQFCFGLYQKQVHLSGSISLSSESTLYFGARAATADDLVSLLGRTITAAGVQPDGSVLLTFSSGGTLLLVDGNASGESFDITAPGVTIIV